jgi:predicted CoA-substrate-specific enzyme activase
MGTLHLGIDVGSTTAKLVILDATGQTRFADYRRHHAAPQAVILDALREARSALGDHPLSLLVTGSSGLGLSERFELPFIQEVVASAEVVRRRYPHARTLVDVGGEDAKLILFQSDGMPDIRMNGVCAGGTGAFIDQMAALLNVTPIELDGLAARHTKIFPIASRCGVFAKTDVQNLLSREVGRENIAASIFHAVALQTLVTLARGTTPVPQVLFCGGPLTFLPSLRAAFARVLNFAPEDLLTVERAELLPALGAALAGGAQRMETTLEKLIARLSAATPAVATRNEHRLQPLFLDHPAFAVWQGDRARHQVPRADLAAMAGAPCFVGIDSGSTTTKLVVTDADGRVAFTRYRKNHGDAIGAVTAALRDLRAELIALPTPPVIARAAVTGYGEDLIRSAFGCDEGLVETLAHARAARAFDPEVSFILDIGGQDMKAIFVDGGEIRGIEINEACSSGCGSFVETFAGSLGYGVADFASLACEADAPCDLGTRCTVFMNSKVKQAQREGARVGDISAGLAYSVIKNAINKVLKITDMSVLGDHILVQGGTFRNPAVQRALELLIGRPVVCPDIAELMGAYGAALSARDGWRAVPAPSFFIELAGIEQASTYRTKQINCRGCTNHCTVSKLQFANGNSFFTGNRCERIYSNTGAQRLRGTNLLEEQLGLLFERPTTPQGQPRMTLGIPRVLNLYEQYPFWATLLVESGFELRLSDPSTNAIYERGAGTIASENICFPAKLAHGHILNLLDAGVDRIFYPMVSYERPQFQDANNSYNCPIVTGYPEVLDSTINPRARAGIPLDQPPITFHDVELLRQGCARYLAGLGVDKATFARAFDMALAAQDRYKAEVREAGATVLARARDAGRPVALLLCRPYHLDGLINHRVPSILADLGVDVITGDAVPLEAEPRLENRHVITQWAYTNRFYHAARWAIQQPDVEVVQLNSFACGPDVLATDEVRAVLAAAGKNHTVLRIDEVESLGSARLRLRSLVEARRNRRDEVPRPRPRRSTRTYMREDSRRTILVPDFSHFTSIPIIRPLRDMGLRIEILPSANRESVEVGLKYVNNEICYPAIVLVGDLVKALKSGRYRLDEVAVGLSQTGGQCRDSCYVPLLKKALVANGFEDVPVVALSTNFSPINEQPGMRFNYAVYIRKLMYSLALSDALSAMYHAVAPRERVPGAAMAVADRYLARLDDGRIPLKRRPILAAIRAAASDFNAVEVRPGELPRVAIVGEIFLKLNSFGNNNAVQWLVEQGLEVQLPALMEYFTSTFVNYEVDVRAGLRRRDMVWGATKLVQGYVEGFLREADEAQRDFRFYRPAHSIEQIASAASNVIDLTNHFGEGWLIPGEIGTYVESGVPNILCIQPFGCIANQVVGRGIERRMRERYPQLNILYLDTDAGTSEVNVQNRLYFFVNHARATLHPQAHPPAPAPTGEGSIWQRASAALG